MSDTSLVFNVLANDKASRVIGGVGDAVAKTEGKVKRSFGSWAKSASASFAGNLASDAAQAGIAFIGDFVGGAVGAAKESEKITAQTNAVIKATGGVANVSAGQIGKLSAALSTKTGVDDELIQSGSNLLLTFKNIRNEAGRGNDIFNQSTKAAIDMSAAGFGSVESASKMLGKALNDPLKGISALGRAGVTFTAGQEKEIKALMKKGKVLEAQKVILGEVNGQVGGSAAAQATATDKMKVAWGNLQEELGGALVPMIDKVANVLTNKVVPALSNGVAWVQKNKGAIAAWLPVIGGVLGAIAGIAVVIKVVKAAQVAWNAVMLIAKGATVAWTAVQWLLNAAMTANPIGLVVLAIVALIAIFVLAWKKSETFRKIVTASWKLIQMAASAVGRFFTQTLWPWIKGVWDKIANGARLLVQGIKMYFAAWKAAAVAVKNFVVDKFNAVVSFFKTLPGKIGRAVSGIFDGIKSAFRSAVNWVISQWNNLSLTLGGANVPLPFGKSFTVPSVTLDTPNIPYLAKGGQAVRSGVAIVGEEGPEAVHLDRGASVRPLAGGGGNVLTIRLEGGSGNGLDQLFLSWLQGAIRKNPGVRLEVIR